MGFLFSADASGLPFSGAPGRLRLPGRAQPKRFQRGWLHGHAVYTLFDTGMHRKRAGRAVISQIRRAPAGDGQLHQSAAGSGQDGDQRPSAAKQPALSGPRLGSPPRGSLRVPQGGAQSASDEKEAIPDPFQLPGIAHCEVEQTLDRM